jgi:aspartate racemase
MATTGLRDPYALPAEALDAEGEPRDDVYVFPATPAQHRYWLLDQLEPGNPALNMPLAIRLTGQLDRGALERAVNEVVRRHEALRTSFRHVDGEVMQVIAPSVTLEVSFVELGEGPEADREEAVRQLMLDEARVSFALGRGPLIRATLARVAAEDHVLLVTMHHTVCDGWSNGVLVRELADLYESFAQNMPSPLPDLPLQYADYAHWQREWLREGDFAEHLAYWREQLAGGSAALNLRTDRPRRPARGAPGAIESRLLPAPLARALKAFAKREDVTMFMVLLAAFNALLYLYTGQEDLLIGSPMANRASVETESLIGLFTNSVILRTRLDGRMSFRELLGRVRDVALGAVAHEDVPFEKVVEELQRGGGPGLAQPFNAMFIYQTAFMQPREAHGLRFTPLRSVSAGSLVDLTQSVVERAEGLRLQLEVNTDLFDAATAVRMLGHYHTLLAGAVSDPNRPIAELPLLTAAEREELLGGRDFAGVASQRLGLPAAFEASARSAPEALAVVAGGESLTFAELGRLSDDAGHRLRALGVEPGAAVGVVLGNSAATLASMLGALKAGAVLVPLDPRESPDRHESIRLDAGVRLVLEGWGVGGDPRGQPAPAADPGDVAAAVYAFGASGEPEGAVLTHGALAQRGAALAAELGLRPGDRVGLADPSPTSGALELVFAAWTSGAAVALGPDGGRAGEVWAWVREERPSVLVVSSSCWAGLADALEGDELPKELRLVAVAGPRAAASAVRDWRSLVGAHARVLHLLGWPGGPPLVRELAPADGPFRPVAGEEAYVLDPHLQAVPAGVVGEVYVGGAGLATGYLGRPELSAARFVTASVCELPEAPLFRTGELGCRLPGGGLRLMGPAADRVKLRGYWVWPREVEEALEQHPAVRAAAVVAVDGGVGPRLVGYVAAAGGAGPSAGELRAHLRELLPEYAVPAAVVVMDALPLGRDGRVDRGALPPPERAGQPDEPEALSPTEFRLAQIWEDLLGVRPEAAWADFFDLGGHSLLAVRLMDRIEKEFGKRLPLAVLFGGATVRQLAHALLGDAKARLQSTLVQIRPGTAGRAFFCVSGPKVNALGYAFLARHLGPGRPVYGLQSEYERRAAGEYTQPELEELAAEYIRAMRAAQPEGPYFFGGLCSGASIAFEMARQLEAQGQQVGLLAIFDTWVLENTYSYVPWLLDYYARRAGSLVRSPGEHGAGLRRLLSAAGGKLKRHAEGGDAPAGGVDPEAIPWRAQYFPGPDFVPLTYRGRVTLFRIHKQPFTRIRDYELGWRMRALGGVEVHLVPGDHETIMREPHVRELAAQLEECLSRAEAREGS